MEAWTFIQKKLAADINIILLHVLQSEGSSPGRQGFKMAVAADDDFFGTIGGGIMEHKLVEKAKVMLQQQARTVTLQHQYHDKEKVKDQSGMICSGSQLNAFVPLFGSDLKTVEKIIASPGKAIQLSPKGLTLADETIIGLDYKTNEDWVYTEAVNQQPVIHIIGGGHVGLALSELMKYLGFYVNLYDDRPNLNTITANTFADEKHKIDYENIGDLFNNAARDFVVIMTVGYRTDKTVLKQLIDKPFYYIGLLGSDNKINILLKEMKAEGFTAEALNKVHTPIGINILSKTSKEIAVSIAAEIIREKNRDLPTGRNQD